MTFLAKLGAALAKGIAVASGIWPLVGPLFGSSAKAQNVSTTVSNDLLGIGQIVATTEAILQTPGSGGVKLAAATPLVAGLIKSSELVAGHKIVNEALFTQGCQSITSGSADILNSLDPSAVQTSGSPIVVPPPAPATVAVVQPAVKK